MIKVMQRLFGGVVNEQNYAEFLKELGRKFVPKAEYNARLVELKEQRLVADECKAAAEELVSAKAKAENLAQEISGLRAELAECSKANAAEVMKLKKEHWAEVALLRAGAKNLRAAQALLDMSELAEGFEEAQVAEMVAKLKEAAETAFLFEQEVMPVATDWQGFVPAEAGDILESGYAGGFRLRLAQAQNAADCLEAIRVKQEAAANGVII